MGHLLKKELPYTMHDQHHSTDHRHHPELYHRLMPYIERAYAFLEGASHMDAVQLRHLADRVMHESGILHHMPLGHTEETIRDFIHALLLTLADGEEAVEAMVPIAPWVWPGPFFNPFFFPFFPGPRHRMGRPHHGGPRPGGRPGRGGRR